MFGAEAAAQDGSGQCSWFHCRPCRQYASCGNLKVLSCQDAAHYKTTGFPPEEALMGSPGGGP